MPRPVRAVWPVIVPSSMSCSSYLWLFTAALVLTPACSEASSIEPTTSSTTSTNQPATSLESALDATTTTDEIPCVELRPDSDFQAVVDQAGASASFCLTDGTFVGFSVRPHDDQTFTGVPGTVLDGETIAEHAFWTDHDRPSDRVRISDLEITRYRSPRTCAEFTNSCSGAMVRGGAIRPHSQVVEGPPSTIAPELSSVDWEVTNVLVHANEGTGVVIGQGMVLSQSTIRDNSHLGVGGGIVSSAVIANNTFSNNSYDQRLPANWELGQMKLGFVSNVQIRGNTFDGGTGPAIWCDIQCTDVAVTDNQVIGSSGPQPMGIYIEASERIEVVGNVVAEISGVDANCGVADGVGISIAESRSVTVANNTVTDSDIAVLVQQRDRSDWTVDLDFWAQVVSPDTDRLWTTRDVEVTGNTFEGGGDCRPDRSGRVGLWAEQGDHPNLTGVAEQVTFRDNLYADPIATRDFVWGQDELEWAAWAALGNE